MTADSFLISPGHETHVSIDSTSITADSNLRESLTPEKRGCYFDGEFYLQLFGTYSVNNCWMECLMNLTREKLDSKQSNLNKSNALKFIRNCR